MSKFQNIFTSTTGLQHNLAACEPEEDVQFERVYEGDHGATIRVCQICGARRSGLEDRYDRASSQPTERERET